MVREQDDISIAFLLWEQSRNQLREAENKLFELRRNNDDPRALDVLEAEIALLSVRTERLLGQAIEALREHSERLVRKAGKE